MQELASGEDTAKCPFNKAPDRETCPGIDIDVELRLLKGLEKEVRKWEELHMWDKWEKAKEKAEKRSHLFERMTLRDCCNKDPRYPVRRL